MTREELFYISICDYTLDEIRNKHDLSIEETSDIKSYTIRESSKNNVMPHVYLIPIAISPMSKGDIMKIVRGVND